MDDDLKAFIEEYKRERRRISKKYGKESNMLERLKSPVFWTQLVLLIAEVLKLFGVYEISNDVLNGTQDVITLAFQVFSGLNNPTTRDNF